MGRWILAAHAGVALVIAAWAPSCSREGDEPGGGSRGAATARPTVVDELPLRSPPPPGQPLFEQLSAERTGLRLAPASGAGAATGGAGTAIAIGDLDGDGSLDLFFGGGGVRDALFLQDRSSALTFREVTPEAGLGDPEGSSDRTAGAAMTDLDGDGDLDLFVTREGGPSRLLLNAGGAPPSFVDQAAAFGLEGRGEGGVPLFADIDRDGDLDLFLLARSSAPGTSHRLLRNDPGGGSPAGSGSGAAAPRRFVDITEAAGIRGNGARDGLWFDFNDDRFPDLFVAGGNAERRLYLNNGDGTFIDLAPAAFPRVPRECAGAAAGDLDGDGRPDLAVADAAPLRGDASAALYVGSGTPHFLELSHLAELAPSSPAGAVLARDFDGDGRNDLILLPADPGPPIAHQNLGDLVFGPPADPWFPSDSTTGPNGAAADLDRDGDLDIVSAPPGTGGAVVFANRSASDRAGALVVKLVDEAGREAGAGALVTVAAGSRVQTERPQLGRESLASAPPMATFGLGSAPEVSALTIEWPNGEFQSLDSLPADRVVTVARPPGGSAGRVGVPPKAPALFREAPAPSAAVHREKPFDEFAAQPLLPRLLSRQGPAIAVADVDGDGDDDFFLGGAAGESGRLFLNDGRGGFSPSVPPPLARDAASEDAGALFFEADGDGDPDLYVVSGGVEHAHGTIELLDRLYLNDGTGRFDPAPAGALPRFPESGSCVIAGDIDSDGDLDLFVGGRVTAGRYPFSPPNRILINDGAGAFVDATATVGSELEQSGMVAAAVFSDVDSDGAPDLVLAHEWGPVSVFLNRGGSFREHAAGLLPHGWWNSLAARDLDGDGDIDFVAGNAGLNSGLRADAEGPLTLLAGDLDGRGTFRLLEAVWRDGRLRPTASSRALAAALPGVARDLDTSEGAPVPGVDSLLSASRLENALRLEATELRTGVFLNDGDGTLRFSPLPRLVQSAPVFGIVVTEIDGDRLPDLVVAQNEGRLLPGTSGGNGGVGLVMRRAEDGTFLPEPGDRSGFVVPDDARSLVTLDADGDGRLDLLVGISDGPVRLFLRQPAQTEETLVRVALDGTPAGDTNPSAIGARVTLRLGNGTTQTAEVSAGSGYLSQSTREIVFGIPQSPNAHAFLEARWPDGSTSELQVTRRTPQPVVLSHPGVPAPPSE